MISVTDAACKEIARLSTGQNQPAGSVLRLFVKAGGCAGMSYGMEFVAEPAAGDKILDLNGVKVCMDPKSYLFLNGITVDFKESLMGRGFVFENPNATGQCGCGTSFSV